ncbi:hypothetical protein [Lichenicoccus sp.]|uniref:hypothetical protein n=1 Tax=Lichenicoccus sp. TaxID=2781899 RepID=UPI003D0BCA51
MRPHVFLATPCYGGVVTQGYMQSVVGLMQQAGIDGYDVTLALLGQDALITRSRNTLLAHFMATTAATHILFIDADISFEATLPGFLVNADKDVVAATYPLKTQYWDADAQRRIAQGEAPQSAALRYVGELCVNAAARREDALATATYVGTGFLLIKRRTIERLIEAYPQTRYTTIHTYPDARNAPQASYALFDCMIDPETQTYLSEDFTFCHRWRAIGGTIWLDTRSSLIHTGPSDFQGRPVAVFG